MQIIRGLVPNSMGKDGGIQRNRVGQRDAGNATVLGDPRSPIKAARGKAQLKCLYTNAHSLSNKQDELETVMHLENYDLVANHGKHGEMTPTTGILPLMGISSLEGIGKVERVGELPSMSKSG